MALVRGVVGQYQSEPRLSEAALWEAVRLFEEVGDEFSLAIALTEASEIVEMYGDYDSALEMLRRGIELSERVGFSVKLLAMRVRLANVETLRGNTERAEQMHLDLLSEVADESVPWLRTMSYTGLSSIARRTQRPEQAQRWIEQAWSVSRTREVPVTQALVLVGRGYTADLWVTTSRPSPTNDTAWRSHSPTPPLVCRQLAGRDGRRTRDRTRSEPPRSWRPACSVPPMRSGADRVGRCRPRSGSTSTAPSGAAADRWAIGHSTPRSRSVPGATSRHWSPRCSHCSDHAIDRTRRPGSRPVSAAVSGGRCEVGRTSARSRSIVG